MFRLTQNCKNILLSASKEKFDEFFKSYKSVSIIENTFYDNEFLEKFFQVDLDFFAHVILSHEYLETCYIINRYIQKHNMTEHAKIVYARYDNDVVYLTEASLICLEHSIERNPNDVDLISNFAQVLIDKKIDYKFDIKPFCLAFQKMKNVKYVENENSSDVIFCHYDLVGTLVKIMVFPPDTRIDVRYLLALYNFSGHFVKLLKKVESFATVFYGNNHIEFKFSQSIMAYLISRFNLTNDNLLKMMKHQPTVEIIDFYYGKTFIDQKPSTDEYTSPEDTFKFCRKDISHNDTKKLATPFQLPSKLMFSAYFALKNKGVKFIGQTQLCIFDDHCDNDCKITVADCERIDFNDISSIRFSEIDKDVFIWFTDHQPEHLYKWLKAYYCEPYQLKWLFAWMRIHKETLLMTMIFNFETQILPDEEILTILKVNEDLIDINTVDFSSFRFVTDNTFWETLLHTFPKLVEMVILENMKLGYNELDKYMIPRVDREISIQVGETTTVEFMNYIRQNSLLISLDFESKFTEILDNVECFEILDIMAQEPHDLHKFLISVCRIHDEFIYQIYGFDIDHSIIEYMKTKDLFTKWKIGFTIKHNYRLPFTPEYFEYVQKTIPGAVIYCFPHDEQDDVEYIKTYFPLLKVVQL